jgi:hypothetical protein
MIDREIVRSTGDATLSTYSRTFDTLTLHLTLWDESPLQVTAHGVQSLLDEGSWEVDGIVRLPALDHDSVFGFGLIDTEGVVTMRFAALRLEFDR